jgi:hypothetical protein
MSIQRHRSWRNGPLAGALLKIGGLTLTICIGLFCVRPAGATIYTVSLSNGSPGFTVSGSITTDGTLGFLSRADIVDWNLVTTIASPSPFPPQTYDLTGPLSGQNSSLIQIQANAYAMIGRRGTAAGIKTKVGNHTFRATGITAYLKNGGTLENAAAMANHASTRTTQLYDRRRDEMSLDEVERISI